MENNDAIFLRKELEYYSNLIAEHEKGNGKANINPNYSAKNIQDMYLYPKQTISSESSLSKKCNGYKTNNFLRPGSLMSCSRFSSHSIKKQTSLDHVLTTSKFSFSKNNSHFYPKGFLNKKLPNYSTKNQFLKPEKSLRGSEYVWCNAHICDPKSSNVCDDQVSKASLLNDQLTTKLYPEKLIGEIMSVTEQLKMKSESFNVIKNKQQKFSSMKETVKKRKEIIPYVKKNSVIAKLSIDKKTLNTNKRITNWKCHEEETKGKITYFNVLKDLKALEKKLSEVKEPKKSLMKPLILKNSVADRKIASNKFVSKYSSPKNQAVKTTSSCSGQACSLNSLSDTLKCSFVPLSNVPNTLSQKSNQLTFSYKKINNMQTSLKKFNPSHKIMLTKHLKKYRQCTTPRKKNIFKLANQHNMTKIRKYVRKTPTSVENSFGSNFPSLHAKTVPTASLLDSDIDLDLLHELASESIPQTKIYRSKNTIINHHSMKYKAAKMIKSKYFTKKSCAKKNDLIASKYFRSHFNNSTNRLHYYSKNVLRKRKCTSRNHFLNKYQSQNSSQQKKNIVNLDGEKFIIGSSGKTLRKVPKLNPYSYRKTPTRMSSPKINSLKISGSKKVSAPVSKTLASRALNRSIDTVLSASIKKKVKKINIYCMFYNRFGRCNKGIKCSYVHDPSKIAVCTRFLRGTCKNEKCLFMHEINPGKMAICSFFLRGSCTKSDCPYRHEKLSPDAKLCKSFIQGYCPDGKECLKAHVLLCPKYIQGICKKGMNCSFIHTLDKNIYLNNDASLEKSDDLTFDITNRYFECNSQKTSNANEGSLVVPRLKCLPEQPSFISLKMNESA